MATETKTVRLKIKRCDGPGKPSRWELFDVPAEPGDNIISCLQYIAANPVTADGKRTTPVVWDSCCLEEICGACTMLVNGGVRQSCSALIGQMLEGATGGVITLEPMSKFPLVRDLWVDRSRLFNDLKRVRAWVPIDGTYDMGPGPRESADEAEVRYKLSTCMSCGCCLEACPQYLLIPEEQGWKTNFIGAAPISQARLFNLHDTGRHLLEDRMDVLTGPGGVSDCGNAQNCVKVCPKEIPLAESIGAVGRAVTVHSIMSWFSGK